MTKTTVIRAGLVLADPAEAPVAGDLVVTDGVVAGIEEHYNGHWDVELDAEGALVLPGFINAHVHPGATPVMRSIAEDIDVVEDGAFYHQLMPTRQLALDMLSDKELADIIEWDALAAILGGATTIIAEDFGSALQTWPDVAQRLGFRTSYGLTFPNNAKAIGYTENGVIVRDAVTDIEASFQASVEVAEGIIRAGNPRFTTHLSPHGPDTVSDEILRAAREKAVELGIGLHLHLAQHQSECDAVYAKSGLSSAKYLDTLGFLGPDVLAVHNTYADSEDWRLLAERGVTVVHCPYRKAKEGRLGTIPFGLEHRARLALGTDSFSHDLFEDLRLGALLLKTQTGRVGSIRATDLLAWATTNGAAALGRADLGRLSVGARGDAITVDISQPGTSPAFDPIRSLVYYGHAGALRHSVVDGEPIIRDGRPVNADVEALRLSVSAACHRLWAAAREQGTLPVGV